MKTMLLLSTLIAVTSASQAARADFNLDAKNGKISCSDADGSTVTIDKNRKNIRVHITGNEGSDSFYTVESRQTDGDTAVIYLAGEAKLTLSDRGDLLEFSDAPGEGLSLDCN